MGEKTCWIAQRAPRWLARCYWAWACVAYLILTKSPRFVDYLTIDWLPNLFLPAAGAYGYSESFDEWLAEWHPAPVPAEKGETE